MLKQRKKVAIVAVTLAEFFVSRFLVAILLNPSVHFNIGKLCIFRNFIEAYVISI